VGSLSSSSSFLTKRSSKSSSYNNSDNNTFNSISSTSPSSSTSLLSTFFNKLYDMLPGPGPQSSKSAVLTVVIVYMAFSSTMLIINKAAVKFFPFTSTLLWLQMGVSAALVWMLGQINYLKVDKLEWQKIQAYFGVVVVFIFNLFTNMKAVQYSNIETVIVFQTLTSLAVAWRFSIIRRRNSISTNYWKFTYYSIGICIICIRRLF